MKSAWLYHQVELVLESDGLTPPTQGPQFGTLPHANGLPLGSSLT